MNMLCFVCFIHVKTSLQSGWLLDWTSGAQTGECTAEGVLVVMTAGNVSPQQEVIRKDWMFKLVGKETFTVGSAATKATIVIEAVSGFAYEYTLEIAGKSLQKFIDNRAQTTKTWLLKVDGEDCRVVLGEPAAG